MAETHRLRYILNGALVLVTIAWVFQTYQLDYLRKQRDAAPPPDFIQHCLQLISDNVAVNIVPEDVIAPRLLKDTEEIAQYLLDFPLDDYTPTPLPGYITTDQIYLDDADDFIKNLIREGITWEPWAVNTFIKYVTLGSTVVDVGAHIGIHTTLFSRLVGNNGRVYAIEPQKKMYRELYNNLLLNNITNVVPLRYAAGDQNSIIEMNPTAPNNEGATAVGAGGDQAEMRTVDSFGFNNVSLLKIDVEHLEDIVLEGSRDTIARNKPVIYIEIQGGRTLDNMPPEILGKLNATKALIENMGYSMIRVAHYDYLGIPNT